MKLIQRLLWVAILFFVFLFPLSSTAQSSTVTGTVVRANTGEPLIGASISVKGSSSTTISGVNGEFSISVPSKNAVLVITYIGMTIKEIPITNVTENVTVRLEESASVTLSDVVVVGYGTQKITNVSGAISTIKSADIQKLGPVRTEEVLQGRAAGVNVIQNGAPGAKPTVLIRGIPSFSGTDPVVIIDGVPQSLTDFNSINAADIESINVLKDAATTAIYGVKGGNGVIVVTTKSGRKNQKTEISASSVY